MSEHECRVVREISRVPLSDDRTIILTEVIEAAVEAPDYKQAFLAFRDRYGVDPDEVEGIGDLVACEGCSQPIDLLADAYAADEDGGRCCRACCEQDPTYLDLAELRALASCIPDPFALSELFDGTPRAAEQEYMVAETIHAAVLNLGKHGEPFSIRGEGVRSTQGGGLVDNATAYGRLLSEGYFREEERQGIGTVIFPTRALLARVRAHLDGRG